MSKKQKCRDCGCTQDNACVDKDGNACYWVEENLCSNCKTYVFFTYQGKKSKPVRTELKESELEQGHKDILLGEMLQIWNNCPRDVRNAFLQKLQEAIIRDNDKNFENHLKKT